MIASHYTDISRVHWLFHGLDLVILHCDVQQQRGSFRGVGFIDAREIYILLQFVFRFQL